MNQINLFEWKKLCKVDPEWVEKNLLDHKYVSNKKLVVRVFSVKFAGTSENLLGFVQHLINQIPNFVFSERQLMEFKQTEQWPWKEAMHYFGNVPPDKDGRYGELLLFLLVESILKTPMIVHKIKVGTSVNVQIKGSDGIYFGNYNDNESLLLGESKIYQNKNRGINDALTSVNKFHDGAEGLKYLKQELSVASSNITDDLSIDQVEYIADVLDPKSTKFQNVNIVHPILVVYNENEINEIEIKCQSKEEGEEFICNFFKSIKDNLISNILQKLENNNEELKKISLDFFFIAMKDISIFRDFMYKEMHNL